MLPGYSAAGPEQKGGDEVQPFDDWAVSLHPAIDLEAQSKTLSQTRSPLREDNCDDLQTAQSVKATVLRAARLKFMRNTADYVSAGEQAQRAVCICYQSCLISHFMTNCTLVSYYLFLSLSMFAEQELSNLQQRWQTPEHPLRFNDW